MIALIQSTGTLLGAFPLAPVVLLLMIYTWLPPAADEENVWARLPASN